MQMATRRAIPILATVAVLAALAWPSAAFAQDPDQLWRAGQRAHDNRDYRGCVENLRNAFRAAGGAYDRWGWLHMALGICLGQRGQYDEAISELQTALDLISEDSERWSANNSLAQMYIARGNSGDYDRAVVAENEAGKYATSAGQRALHSKTLGQAYYFKQDWNNAISYLSDAAEARPADANVAQQLGRAHLESGNDAEALSWFEKMLSLDRNKAAAITDIAQRYLDLDKPSRARELLVSAAAADPEDDVIRRAIEAIDSAKASEECRVTATEDEFTGEITVMLPVTPQSEELVKYDGAAGIGPVYIKIESQSATEIALTFAFNLSLAAEAGSSVLTLIDGERGPNLIVTKLPDEIESLQADAARFGIEMGSVYTPVSAEVLARIGGATEFKLRIPTSSGDYDRSFADTHFQCVQEFVEVFNEHFTDSETPPM